MPDSLLDDLAEEGRRQLFDALDAAGDDDGGGADSFLEDLMDEQRRWLDDRLDDPYGDDWAPTDGELDEIDRLVEQMGAGENPLDFYYELSDPEVEQVLKFGIQGYVYVFYLIGP